jgi:hypothetical protein
MGCNAQLAVAVLVLVISTAAAQAPPAATANTTAPCPINDFSKVDWSPAKAQCGELLTPAHATLLLPGAHTQRIPSCRWHSCSCQQVAQPTSGAGRTKPWSSTTLHSCNSWRHMHAVFLILVKHICCGRMVSMCCHRPTELAGCQVPGTPGTACDHTAEGFIIAHNFILRLGRPCAKMGLRICRAELNFQLQTKSGPGPTCMVPKRMLPLTHQSYVFLRHPCCLTCTRSQAR